REHPTGLAAHRDAAATTAARRGSNAASSAPRAAHQAAAGRPARPRPESARHVAAATTTQPVRVPFQSTRLETSPPAAALRWAAATSATLSWPAPPRPLPWADRPPDATAR